MHAIWRNNDILSRIALHLQSSSSVHVLIPLLSVNKAWRALVTKKLLEPFQSTGVYRTGARAGQVNGTGFLKFVVFLLPLLRHPVPLRKLDIFASRVLDRVPSLSIASY
jgi:hypothetical protein